MIANNCQCHQSDSNYTKVPLDIKQPQETLLQHRPDFVTHFCFYKHFADSLTSNRYNKDKNYTCQCWKYFSIHQII